MFYIIYASINTYKEVSMRRRINYVILSLIFLLSVIIGAACTIGNKQQREQNSFDRFINEMFIKEVQADTLSLNYTLANPENYGITIEKASLGNYTIQTMNDGITSTENYMREIDKFNYELLSPDQQLTYKILIYYLEQKIISGDFIYYNECLGPTTGIQAQLPILLAEYNFYDPEDIDYYLELLPSIYDYFKDIAEYQREKSKHGLFMSDKNADIVIEQCQSFIADTDNNFLIEYFNDKIYNYPGLSSKQILAYQNTNKEAVTKYVIPAYKMLINVLQELKGSGTNDKGLYYYSKGKEYYSFLVKKKTGSSKPMAEITRMLDKAINKSIEEISSIYYADGNIIDKLLSFDSFPLTEPKAIMEDLKKGIAKDFPELISVDYDIKYIHESLEDYLSPAMYLVPAIDSYNNNTIYINGRDDDTLSTIYTTVAHEGYPGHLYQCVYFRNTNPAPIRNLMDFIGYDEGWATYVEMYSYQLTGIDDNLAKVFAANNILILCMYARADIGIHYEGWTKEEVVSYVLNYISSEETAELIYYTLLEEPAIYLPYAVGCLEILELRNQAETALREQFTLKDFHTFLLDIGPAPFGIIEEHLNQWIDNRSIKVVIYQ